MLERHDGEHDGSYDEVVDFEEVHGVFFLSSSWFIRSILV